MYTFDETAGLLKRKCRFRSVALSTTVLLVPSQSDVSLGHLSIGQTQHLTFQKQHKQYLEHSVFNRRALMKCYV